MQDNTMAEEENVMPGRYAILTDIHGNKHALSAVIEAVHAENSLPENHANPYQFWFLGDIIGYGPQPLECLNWLRYKSGIDDRWVPGNHDVWLIDPELVGPDATESLERHRVLLADTTNQDISGWFFDQLKKRIDRSLVREEIDDLSLLFVHASLFGTRRRTYMEPWKTTLLETEFASMGREINPGTNAILFCGHAHYPLFAHQLPDGQVALRSIRYYTKLKVPPGLNIINPGSIGQPRDGDPRAAYALFDARSKTIEFRRVAYDVEGAIQALEDKGYSKSLGDRLRTGDGMSTLAYLRQVYRRPTWDLEAIGSPAPGELPEDLGNLWDGRR